MRGRICEKVYIWVFQKMNNMDKLLFVGILIFAVLCTIVDADDSQFYTACGGGDLQSYIGCFGDAQNSFIGSVSVDVVATSTSVSTVVPPSGGFGGPVATSKVGDRFYEYTFSKTGEVSDGSIIFSVIGERVVRGTEPYSIRLVSERDDVFVRLDEVPRVDLFDPLNRLVVSGEVMGDEGVDGYVLVIPTDKLVSSGIYKVVVSLKSNGVVKLITESFEVVKSRDLLEVTKVGEVAPLVQGKLTLVNEGVVGDEYTVRYWLTKVETGGFDTGIQARSFTKFLVSRNKSSVFCGLGDLKPECSGVESVVSFELDPASQGSYWLKAESCHNYKSVKSDCFVAVKSVALQSQASVLLNVRGTGVIPEREVPEVLTFTDFLLSAGSGFWPSSPVSGVVLVCLFSLIPFILPTIGGVWLRKKSKAKLDRLTPVVAFKKRGGG